MLDHKLGTCMLEVLGDNETLTKEILNKEKDMAPDRVMGRQYVKAAFVVKNHSSLYAWANPFSDTVYCSNDQFRMQCAD